MLIEKHRKALATGMGDEERLIPANSMPTDHTLRYRCLADQANLHIEASLPLCELLGMGVAFGGSRHDHIWRRTVEHMGNVASQPRTGVDMSLLDLRYLPMLMLAYSALIVGVDRDNYAAIGAALIDARIRNDENQKVSVISCADPWRPFRHAELVPNIALIDAESGEMCDLDRIGRLINGAERPRFTPGSNLLHCVLREPLRPMIHDDRDYTETFDNAEVLLALMTADAVTDTPGIHPVLRRVHLALSSRAHRAGTIRTEVHRRCSQFGERVAAARRGTIRRRRDPFSICR